MCTTAIEYQAGHLSRRRRVSFANARAEGPSGYFLFVSFVDTCHCDNPHSADVVQRCFLDFYFRLIAYFALSYGCSGPVRHDRKSMLNSVCEVRGLRPLILLITLYRNICIGIRIKTNIY